MDLQSLLESNRKIRVLGIDDAPVEDAQQPRVHLAGVVCALTRFEGMLWGDLTKDGIDATECISSLVLNSKFHTQCHLVLLDGITFGGCNIVDLQALNRQIGLPVVAVMRRHPDLVRFRQVVDLFDDRRDRWRKVESAGPIHELQNWTFQVIGAEPSLMAGVLDRLTDRGHVPEALRLAHLIGSAVILGESSKRA